jgi:hypothetical protein
MSKIKNFILQLVFPGFYAAYANKKVSNIYEKRKKFDVDFSDIPESSEKKCDKADCPSTKTRFSEYIEQLKTDLIEQHNRKKIIEEKAKSLLFIITVSITAITFSLNYLNSLEINTYQIIALIILGISILFFVEGTIRVIQTLNIREFNIIQAEVKEEEDSSKFKLLARKSEEEYLKELIQSKQLNDLINVRLANYAYASFNLIRNGIILFVTFFIMTICVTYFTKQNKTKDTYPINKEIQMKINDSIDVKIPYTFELKYDIKNLEIDKQERNNSH